MKLDIAITAVLNAETAITDRLQTLGERHRADHDVHHMAGTLRTIAASNLKALTPLARRYDRDSPAVLADENPTDHGREKASRCLRSRPEDSLLLLVDLRELHLLYAAASIDWVILAQGVKAARDADLLDAITHAHAQTLRGLKWTVTRIKAAAPQTLTS